MLYTINVQASRSWHDSSNFSKGSLPNLRNVSIWNSTNRMGSREPQTLLPPRDEVPIPCTSIKLYGDRNVYITFEFGLFYTCVSYRNIVFGSLKGRKLSKYCVLVLTCANSDSTWSITPLVAGYSVRPKIFDGTERGEFGFDYIATLKARMNCAIFSNFLFDSKLISSWLQN